MVKKLGFTSGPGGLASTGAVTDVRALLEQRKARTGPFAKKKKKVQVEKKKQKKQKKDKKVKSKPVTDFPNPARESLMAASMKSHEQDCPLDAPDLVTPWETNTERNTESQRGDGSS